ncbi:sirohydrochlorin chelatase [Pseudonocardia sp.]|uniref:sirohydrochlorin chelatase n=1 Tax=Pseudonocardia sp. TaxID=60912 RepID=UPI003D0CDBD4
MTTSSGLAVRRPGAPALLLVAHGTREAAGAVVVERIAAGVRSTLAGVEVRVCYADVRSPTPAEALSWLPGPCVAVPMFLAAGYHVRVDVPEQLRAAGRADVLIADALGPDPLLVAAAAARLADAGARRDDAVVLAVAGSSDVSAQADSATAARRLGRLLGGPVALATIAAGGPRVPDAVADLRAAGAARVAVASWLLAPGLFQRHLDTAGADVVGEPLADHPAVPALVVQRYRAALAAGVRTA